MIEYVIRDKEFLAAHVDEERAAERLAELLAVYRRGIDNIPTGLVEIRDGEYVYDALAQIFLRRVEEQVSSKRVPADLHEAARGFDELAARSD